MAGVSNRRAVVLTVVAAVAPFLVAGISVYLNAQDRERIRADNRYLQQEIAQYDVQIKEIKELRRLRREVLARMEITQSLSGGRLASQEMLLALSRIPAGIQLTRVEFDDTTGLIDGQSLSPALVSRMSQQLRESALGWTTRVNQIAESADLRLLQFRIELSRQPGNRDEVEP